MCERFEPGSALFTHMAVHLAKRLLDAGQEVPADLVARLEAAPAAAQKEAAAVLERLRGGR